MRDGMGEPPGGAPASADAMAQEKLAADLAYAILAADLLALPQTRAALAKALATLDAEAAPPP